METLVRGGLRRYIMIVLLCALGQGFFISPAIAEETGGSGTSDLLMGASCLVVGVPYTAFKLTFAGLGAIFGTFTYALTGGDEEAAKKVWDPSLRGTYIITPEHLKGEKRVEFVGKNTAG
jgi:hypothetical protein